MGKEKKVCFGFPKWEGEYLKSTVQLMKKLSNAHNVLYVDYPFTLSDVCKGIIGLQNFPVLKILGIQKRLDYITNEDGSHTHLLRLPPIIPANWIKNPSLFNLISKINGFIILVVIKRNLKKLGMTEPVVINAFNPWLGLFLNGRLNEKKLIYYCYDEITAAPWINKHGGRLEKAFLPLADHVVVSSSELCRNKSNHNKKISLVRNGVDTKIFGVPTETDNIIPSSDNQSKVVGFLGSLDIRIDTDLLVKTIQASPNYTFLFVGRITDQSIKNILSKFPNVLLKGPRPIEVLAEEIDSMDVCIIPFKKNKLTSGIYPLKINEYLLRGKPIISTHFSDLSDFSELINIAQNHDQFIQLIQDPKIYHRNDKTINSRKNFALKNSWTARSAQFNEILST